MVKIIDVTVGNEEGGRIAEWVGPNGERIMLGVIEGVSVSTLERMIRCYLDGVGCVAGKISYPASE